MAVIPSQQNCKGIGISILVILSVIGLVALSVVLITPADTVIIIVIIIVVITIIIIVCICILSWGLHSPSTQLFAMQKSTLFSSFVLMVTNPFPKLKPGNSLFLESVG